ncbi:transposase [Marinomonas primoryensis]|uniref:Transposase n=1 Tax=Marinomonas primoryensis TaxID=178399 RepID=A0A859CZA4_9GAMM|nr:transposase [Marinomonas primoryensis]
MSSYYYEPVVRSEDEEIKQRMVEIFEASFYSYEKRRLVIDLKKASFKIGVFKTARLMKTWGLVAKRPKKPHYYVMGNG